MTEAIDSTPVHGLPENYRRPLEPGEAYVPLVPQDGVAEITPRSVLYGVLFCALFSLAAAYLALRVGQGIEAAIPISILAIGISRFHARRSSLLENVIITSIGANSGHVVAGAVFTIPALYMLAGTPGSQVPYPHLWQVVIVSFLGGCLGILFLIPLRHHFLVENHGIFPWPEATATAEILASGESVGDQAQVLAGSALLGMLYDGASSLFRAMSENITLKYSALGAALRRQFFAFNLLNSAATLSIGYIIGLRYSAVIAAGGVLSMFVLVPLIHALGQHIPGVLPPGAMPIALMSPELVFKSYVRILGVGTIAGAGILGVLAGMPAMIRSIGKNLAGLRDSVGGAGKGAVPRIERTLPNSFVAVGLLVFCLASFLFFSFGVGMEGAFFAAFTGTAVVMAIAFLFAPVAARAVATIGTNPISGMTMLTLVITGLVMVRLGFGGGVGMFITLMVGGVVCTALSASGAFATDLKIGQWIGATPARQMGLKFLGTFVAALFTGVAMWGMSHQGFGTAAVPAPQASAMREILDGIFGTTPMPLRWFLFGLGLVFSLVLRLVELPALGFALGMYLPLEMSTPLLLGGVLAWMVNRPGTADAATAKARENRGILVASGLMAGGGIMGVVASFVKIRWHQGFPLLSPASAEGALGEGLALAALTALCIFVVVYSRRAKA